MGLLVRPSPVQSEERDVKPRPIRQLISMPDIILDITDTFTAMDATMWPVSLSPVPERRSVLLTLKPRPLCCTLDIIILLTIMAMDATITLASLFLVANKKNVNVVL